MFSLLMVLISIAMLSAITLATINYIPVDALIAYKARIKAQDGIKQISEGSIRYIKSVTDIDGNVFLPAPGTDLLSTIQPRFAFIPPAPVGMAWSIESSSYAGMPSIAICLYPVSTMNEVIARGVSSVKNNFSSAAIFVGDSCNATSNGSGSYVTYWVIAGHHG